ncbi:MAG: TolC family protein [Saonia sp.]
MKKITFLTCLSIVLGIQIVPGQSILNEYIEIGITNNQQYIKEKINTQISMEDSRQSKSLFLPDISFNASYLLADGGRTIDFPLGDLFNPAYTALNQLTGTNQFPTDIQNVNEQFLPNDFHETKIRVLQPILNTDIFYGYKASRANISVSQAKQDNYENQLVFQITKAYFNHLQLLEQKAILDSTRILIKELVRVNRKFIKYDVATKEVLYNAKAQLDQVDAQIATVNKNMNTSRIFFNFLLNRDLNETIIGMNSNELSPLPNNKSLPVAQEEAIANRSEIKQLNASIEAQDYLIKKEKGYIVPDISVGAEAGYQGFGYTFEDNQDYYLVSFNLVWPIFQGGRNRSEVRKAQLQKDRLSTDYNNVINQIKLEVATAHYELEEALQIYRARTSELKNVTENFKIIQAKYRVNQVLLVQFNEARTNLTTAGLGASIAKYNVTIAKANLHKTIQTTR